MTRVRIVQLANLVTPTSGGIRTVLFALGQAYAAAGHERHLITPARQAGSVPIPGGTWWRVPGPRLPGSGGYRMALRRREVVRRLEQLRPDSIEVSDRYTLMWAAGWAHEHGVRSVALVHEHLADNLTTWLPGRRAAQRIATTADRHLVAAFDEVVCASTHTAVPFDGLATVVPLGVDLDTFAPRTTAPRSDDEPARLRVVGRLSAEKCPQLAMAAVRELHRRGVAARLDVVGTGPLESRLRRLARGLPVQFVGHVPGRAELADLLAAGDLTLCPCPSEGFGLSALESLACGTPIVTTGGGPVDLLRGAGAGAGGIAAPDPGAIVDEVLRILAIPRIRRRADARAAAEDFPWSRTAAAMLAVHGACVAGTGTP